MPRQEKSSFRPPPPLRQEGGGGLPRREDGPVFEGAADGRACGASGLPGIRLTEFRNP